MLLQQHLGATSDHTFVGHRVPDCRITREIRRHVDEKLCLMSRTPEPSNVGFIPLLRTHSAP